jgi:hypothetical protein
MEVIFALHEYWSKLRVYWQNCTLIKRCPVYLFFIDPFVRFVSVTYPLTNTRLHMRKNRFIVRFYYWQNSLFPIFLLFYSQ